MPHSCIGFRVIFLGQKRSLLYSTLYICCFMKSLAPLIFHVTVAAQYSAHASGYTELSSTIIACHEVCILLGQTTDSILTSHCNSKSLYIYGLF